MPPRNRTLRSGTSAATRVHSGQAPTRFLPTRRGGSISRHGSSSGSVAAVGISRPWSLWIWSVCSLAEFGSFWKKRVGGLGFIIFIEERIVSLVEEFGGNV